MPTAPPVTWRDRALAVFFVAVATNGFLMSLPESLGVPVAPDGPWPPLRALHAWAVAQEPAHLDPSPTLIANLVFDGFFQAPFAVILAWALWTGRRAIRTPGLVYGGMAIANMYFYFVQTVFGPHPPLDPMVYWPMNLPWLCGPLLLVAHLWRYPTTRMARGE